MILRNPVPWAIGLMIVIVLMMSSLFRVSETTQAIVLRLGKPERIINGFDPREKFGSSDAGLALKLPLFENVVTIDKRVLDLDMPEQTVLSTDQRLLVVDAFARFRIVDPQQMYQTVGTEDQAREALARILVSRLRNELGRQPFAALLSPERTMLMDDIQASVNSQARQYGAEIIDVRIKRADLPIGAPLKSAYDRMSSARAQEALTIRAQGTKQAVIVQAEANANAARIYATSFGKDPEFYAFYRAMQAYRTAFNDSSSTSMVLTPNNEFLREFEGRRTTR